MRSIATCIDPDTHSVSSRGIGTYRMYFSHFDLACYIEKEAFVPPASDDGDDGPRPSAPLPGNGVRCQVKLVRTSDGNVYYAGQAGNSVWSYPDTSNLSVRQQIVYKEEAVVGQSSGDILQTEEWSTKRVLRGREVKKVGRKRGLDY